MNPLRGIVLKVISALSFTLMSAGIKFVGQNFPTGEIVFFRSLFALLPLLLWLGLRGEVGEAVRTTNVMGHVKRSLIGGCSMFFGFAALAKLPLSDAIAIGYVSPLLAVLLAAVLLKETVQIYRWLAICMGFTGVLVMLTPHLASSVLMTGVSSASVTIGILFALGGALCGATSTIEVRKLINTEKTGSICFYFAVLMAVLGLASIVLGNWVMPSVGEMAILVGIGVAGGIGQILLTMSYRHADTSIIAPFEYTTMIWACLIGWFLFAELPVPAVLFGSAIIIASGVFLMWRQHHHSDAARAARKAGPTPTL
ncbi:DMT family transporter [Chelatococcus sp. GCM10030263]|uniref:DMT family transporter n=1 Tax=Chelatococcus sp. GCM10030263 TaxID=3273387 RepID=UPI0036221225